MEIRGSSAVVTGAGSGIGRAIAIALAREGADVTLSDIDKSRLEAPRAAIESLGQKAWSVRADVSQLAEVQHLFDAAAGAMGHVDILVNNAGVHMAGPVENISLADWRWIIDINLWSVIYGINVFLPHMLERGKGHIVNTASISGLSPVGESAPYAATKCAVVGITESIAAPLRQKGIGVTAVCPGFVHTNIGKGGRLIPSSDGLDELRNSVYHGFNEDASPEQIALLSSLLQYEIITPDLVAEKTVEAIKENKVRVITHDESHEWVRRRAVDIEGLIDEAVRREKEFEETVKLALENQTPPDGAAKN